VRRAAAVCLLVLALGGCVSSPWSPLRPAAILLGRAERAADEQRFHQALFLYDEFLARFPDDPQAKRALDSRDTVAAIVTTREDLVRLREALREREAEVAQLRGDLTRLRQELASRQAESDKLRADLERIKEQDLRMERRR
jgi:hypothetical protein